MYYDMFLILISWTLLLAGLVQSKHHVLDWTAESASIAPDNHNVNGITINKMFPGPTVNVTMGDSLEITLHNLVGHPFTMHWHGIIQKGSPEADGVPYVTQDPIPHKGKYTYKFKVQEQAGTFWYHAHNGLDAEVAYGAFVIMEPKKTRNSLDYDDERVIILSDMWHKSRTQIYRELTTVPYVSIGNPQSILTNGGTFAEWDTSSSLPFNNGYSVINVKPNLRYRLRIVGAQGHSFYSFQIPGHSFTVIEADGTLVKPFETSRIEINSGMRYSVILETKAKVDNYYTYTSILGEGDKVNNGVAILHYEGAPDPTPLRRKLHIPPKNELQPSTWFEDQLETLISHDIPLPTTVKQHFEIQSEFGLENRLPVHKINKAVHKDRDFDLLPLVLNGTHSPGPGMISIKSDGQGVQMILQHLEPENRGCAQHPWHMHGHSFYVVAKGDGFFNARIHNPQIQTNIKRNPILRDTFTFFPNTVPSTKDNTQAPVPPPNPDSTKLRSCGWYALRFHANNPGSWIMHCHNTSHMIMGMQFLINESPRKHRATCRPRRHS